MGPRYFLPHGDGAVPRFGVGSRALWADFTPRRGVRGSYLGTPSLGTPMSRRPGKGEAPVRTTMPAGRRRTQGHSPLAKNPTAHMSHVTSALALRRGGGDHGPTVAKPPDRTRETTKKEDSSPCFSLDKADR